jgi:hypothetical protein
MIPEFLILPIVILAFLTASILLISWDWRISIFILALQYVAVVFLVSSSWPIETAAVKLVAGWMACAVMVLALRNLHSNRINGGVKPISEIVFRLIAAVMAGLFGGTSLWIHDLNCIGSASFGVNKSSFQSCSGTANSTQRI